MRELKKYALDLRLTAVEKVHERYVLLRLTHDEPLPTMLPGQFVEVRVDGSPTTFLRRPISINFVDREKNELWLLVATVGDGTRRLAQLQPGDTLNCVLPLGNGWSIMNNGQCTMYNAQCTMDNGQGTMDNGQGGMHDDELRPLLIGGGVGVAPLLYLGATLKEAGVEPTFLLGARTSKDLLMLDEFRRYGRVFVTTEDGSEGEKGFVTQHSLLQKERFTLIQTCGPTPMMKAVARFAKENGVACEASLENLMACGLGACLCCVEKVRVDADASTTVATNVCVCKDGPVFDVRRLMWD